MKAAPGCPRERAERRRPVPNLGHTDQATHDAGEPINFGLWIYLMSDLALFATYASMTVTGIADGPAPEDKCDLRNPMTEAMLLLVSGVAFSGATLAPNFNYDARFLVGWMLVTGALGAAFVRMAVYDFRAMIVQDAAPPQVSCFYLLIGTPGVHVIAGQVWSEVMLTRIDTFGQTRAVLLRIMRLALFWYLLDIVRIWIFIFVHPFGATARPPILPQSIPGTGPASVAGT